MVGYAIVEFCRYLFYKVLQFTVSYIVSSCNFVILVAQYLGKVSFWGTVKPVLKGHSQNDQILVLRLNIA